MKASQNVYRVDEILDSKAKESLRHLELFARRAVQGLLHGIHPSQRKGISTEFDHHKMYQPGDPLKYIDWKVSARHDRYYVKRYLEDTSLSVRIIVDRSASMRQASDDGASKYLQACRLAACLAYLILNQRDSVGLVLADGTETLWLPTRSAESHLVQILEALAVSDARAEDSLDACLKKVLDRGEQRGCVVAISDFMFDPAPIQRRLARLHAQGHEVIAFQLRDPTEEEFPFNRWVQFGDLENASVSHRLDTVPLKNFYREEYQRLLQEWRDWAAKYDCHFLSYRTDQRVETALAEYIAVRSGVGGA